jgi:hypothetical protein
MKGSWLLISICIIIYGCGISKTEMKNISKHKFILVIMGEDDNGGDEGFMTEGKLIYNEKDNTVSVFKEDVAEPVFILEEDEFDQIEKVDDEMKSDLMNADYMMVLHVKTMPDGMDTSGGRTLPFKYPGHEDDSQ